MGSSLANRMPRSSTVFAGHANANATLRDVSLRWERFYGFFLMPLDSQALDEFYESRIGQVARRLISRRLRTRWQNLSGQRLLGFGHATPYLRSFAEAERALAAKPEAQGPIPWGASGKVQIAL